jgi:hypothetical protein
VFLDHFDVLISTMNLKKNYDAFPNEEHFKSTRYHNVKQALNVGEDSFFIVQRICTSFFSFTYFSPCCI